jgi:hypothetical protein
MPEDTSTRIEDASQVRYVDELQSQNDYWFTITDAARATRRQDITIRRWIAKGQLPVRRKKVGLNQRTRQVRASDLMELTPIVDPAGAITSEEGRLDLKSIPVQQREIQAAQQQLFTTVADIHRELLAQILDMQQQAEQGAAAIREELAEHSRMHQQAVEQLRETSTSALRRQEEALVHLQRDLDTTRAELRQDDERLREDLARQVGQQQQALVSYQAEISTTLDEHRQRFEQYQLEMEKQHQAFAHQRSVIDAALDQQMQSTKAMHQTLEQRMTDAHAALVQRLDGVTSEVKALTETLLPVLDERIRQQITPLVEQVQHQAAQLAQQEQAQRQLLAIFQQQQAAIVELQRVLPERQGNDH